MINMVVGLAFLVAFLGLDWAWERFREWWERQH